jgi:LmbE family N-acetylglucosaminyl deacetylase
VILGAALGAPGAPLRILCLGAHCDDIEIGCGGTVLRLLAERPGSTVRWVAFSSNPRREAEARAAAGEFLAEAGGREVIVKQFKDGYLPFQGAEVKDAFEAAKGDYQPDVILTHHRHDRHQDHRMVAELAWNTYRDHLILEYEIPKYEGDLSTPNLYFPLPEAVVRRKIDVLMRSYPSQAGKRWFRPETFEAVLRLRGIECNAPEGFAEAFHAPKVVM